jgi:hypothetical protein
MTMQTIVYEDRDGRTYIEHCLTASMTLIREEELESAGYRVIHD